jgi:hypothetical protein
LEVGKLYQKEKNHSSGEIPKYVTLAEFSKKSACCFGKVY